MANTLGVCLLALSIFCCTNLSSARQVPKECNKGPSYWCGSLKKASDCGAVGHCISTVWETNSLPVSHNDVSDKVVRSFRQLKDVKDLINAEYLSARVSSSCRDLPYIQARQLCKQNTAHLDEYLLHLLASDTTPETMCRVVELCDNEKLDNILRLNAKKSLAPAVHAKPEKLGSKKCSWGPAYWCSNFSTVHECKATPHCVQRVWSKLELPEDNDSVCKICLDMVKQARDQLESNETQTELKEVFEGSCKLIPIKVVAKECMRLADDFVPELVETLASQMNPQQVCSVAGLCNSARVDQMLDKYDARLKLHKECNSCHTTVSVLRHKFELTSYDDFLVELLKVCGRMSSLSDSCSMLVFNYYEDIVAALKHDLNGRSICLLSGQCAFKQHDHDEFTFPKTEVAVKDDDVPCEFCEQLVKHLRDVLVANTTEIEFEKVLKGLCSQTGKFKDECTHIVEQYYELIYNFLTADLKPEEVCAMMGLCGKKGLSDGVVAPLLPKELADKAVRITQSSKLIGAEEAKIARIPLTRETNVRIMGSTPEQLPIERMFLGAQLNVEGGNKITCQFCETFLHYLQVELSDTDNEEKVKAAVEKVCSRLPASLSGQCRQFVSQYGPALIAMIVQQIDPATVCPGLGLCPREMQVDINEGAGNCPLCLFAVEQLESVLKNNRSEESIRQALDGLCNHLSAKLRTQCVDFVDRYSQQLVEMLVADLNAQEICVYLKLCSDNTRRSNPLKLDPNTEKFFNNPSLMADRNNHKNSLLPPNMLVQTHDQTSGGDIGNTKSSHPLSLDPNTEKFFSNPSLMADRNNHKNSLLPSDMLVQTHNSGGDIGNTKSSPHHPLSLDPNTEKFFSNPSLMADRNNHKDSLLPPDMLVQTHNSGGDIETNEIPDNTVNGQPVTARGPSTVCVICEFILKEIDDEVKDKHNEDEVKKVVHNICNRMPKSVKASCDQFVDKYADLIISLLAQELDPDEVCRELKLCTSSTALQHAREEILDCAVCETVVMAVKKVLSNDKVDRNIVHIIEKSCGLLPAKYSARCHTMLEIYGDSIIHLIEDMGTKGVCAKIGMCSALDHGYLRMRQRH